jgi:hypothetical protein
MSRKELKKRFLKVLSDTEKPKKRAKGKQPDSKRSK